LQYRFHITDKLNANGVPTGQAGKRWYLSTVQGPLGVSV
jgi:hypothetical protein